jgi:hypothetical protein
MVSHQWTIATGVWLAALRNRSVDPGSLCEAGKYTPARRSVSHQMEAAESWAGSVIRFYKKALREKGSRTATSYLMLQSAEEFDHIRDLVRCELAIIAWHLTLAIGDDTGEIGVRLTLDVG